MKKVNDEIAKRLKAIGYDGEAIDTHVDIDSNSVVQYPRPYLEEVAEWLRDKHAIYIDIKTMCVGEAFCGYVKIYGKYQEFPDVYGDTWVDTLEKAIAVALNNLETMLSRRAKIEIAKSKKV